jgi:release factor glutamine methyltransferase
MPSLRHHRDLASYALKNGPHPNRASQDAEALLLHVLGKDKAWLIAHAEASLTGDKQTRYAKLLERRHRGEPIQYITGETEFYGLPFRVTRDVLIPRPETEHTVEKVLSLAVRFDAPRVVDVGTGSGAIAVTLAHHLPHALITAVDLSSPALAVARKNAELNQVSERIRFLQGDLLAPVAAERFDFVVSNPPYVPATDRATLAVEVRDYEPEMALFAGNDGLEVYRRLLPAAFDTLIPGGFLILEIGYGQSHAIIELLVQFGFRQIDFVPDLQGIPRVACAQRS